MGSEFLLNFMYHMALFTGGLSFVLSVASAGVFGDSTKILADICSIGIKGAFCEIIRELTFTDK